MHVAHDLTIAFLGIYAKEMPCPVKICQEYA